MGAARRFLAELHQCSTAKQQLDALSLRVLQCFFFQARIANREKAVLLLRSCRATRILRGPTSGQSSQSLLLPQSILAMRKDSDKKTFAK